VRLEPIDMRWLERNAVGRALVEECEAFLEGRYAELCEQRDGTVPQWAWLNLPAHGAPEALRAAAAAPPHAERWRRARAFVAGEVIAVVDRGRADLATLQQQVLVPFEQRTISIARRTGASPPLGRAVNDLLEALSDKRAHLRA
jgi:hypothetical protein